MKKPIINSHSEKMLNAIIKKMPQALLVHGKKGVGLGEISKYIAELRDVKPSIILPEKDEKIDLENGVVSIKSIRDIYNETRTKTSKERIIIIDYAERMTVQSQNAFLKLLEEPGKGVYFILISNSISKLLPTILSRTEKLEIRPISASQSKKLLDDLSIADNTKRLQLLFMASGLPAELTKLATDDDYFKARAVIVRDARDSLTESLYEKLRIAQEYKDNRTDALLLLSDILSILNQSIGKKPQISTINRIDTVLETYKKIEANGNIRLCLTRMFV